MTPNSHWWQHAVVYQVYVRSFSDSDGDGIGDLEGLRRNLDHIARLGVDAIWLNPVTPSPQRDHGYDVADYVDIDPVYGDLVAFDRLVADATTRGLRIVMDIVPNHSSDQHPWFRAAIASREGSDERARFWFRDGRGLGGGEPPNNWAATFGGSVWTRVAEPDGQWYLGTFSPYQPDWNHTHPAVAALFDDTLRFWFDRGVDGFRVDAVPPVGKHPDLPDAPPLEAGDRNPYSFFRPEGHDVWRRWRRVVDEYTTSHPGRDLLLVGEAYTPRRPDLLAEYTRPDEFHQCFAFDLLMSPWHGASMRDALTSALTHVRPQGGWPTMALNNHDAQRIVTRLGRSDAADPQGWTGDVLAPADADVDLVAGTRRARAAAGLLLALPGGVYLYQGEELGLPEVLDVPDSARQDPVFAGTNGRRKGRDGCRIPLPWTTAAANNHGFSAGAGRVAEPWLPQPAGWGRYGVDRQTSDATSMLTLYRRLITARRDHLGDADLEVVERPDDDPLVVLRRDQVLVACNTSPGPVELAEGRGRAVLLTTGADSAGGVVPPDTTVWFS